MVPRGCTGRARRRLAAATGSKRRSCAAVVAGKTRTHTQRIRLRSRKKVHATHLFSHGASWAWPRPFGATQRAGARPQFPGTHYRRQARRQRACCPLRDPLRDPAIDRRRLHAPDARKLRRRSRRRVRPRTRRADAGLWRGCFLCARGGCGGGLRWLCHRFSAPLQSHTLSSPHTCQRGSQVLLPPHPHTKVSAKRRHTACHAPRPAENYGCFFFRHARVVAHSCVNDPHRTTHGPTTRTAPPTHPRHTPAGNGRRR